MNSVLASAEFERVRDLPRRPPVDTSGAVEALTEYFRRPGGTQTLRPIQARALLEALEIGALVGIIGAGAGKTLVSALLPTAF